MTIIERTYKIRGVVPLRMSSSGAADLLDPRVVRWKELAAIPDKDRTDSVDREMSELEFRIKANLGADGEPCIPAENFERMLVDGAKKGWPRKGLSDKVKVGVFVESDARLIHGGGSFDEIAKDPKFRLTKLMPVSKTNRAMVSKTRPVFPSWSANVKLSYDDEVVDAKELDDLVRYCGSRIGLLDSRPRNGRFIMEE